MPPLVYRAVPLVLVAALTAACGKSAARLPVGTPVVLVTIDTLRSDRLAAYGYGAGSAPHIDALAREAVVYERAYAPAPLTLPSHATLLTGLEPTAHGVRSNLGYALDSRHPTLATLLGARGYATGGFVSAYVLRRATGIAAGFTTYDDAIEPRPGESLGAIERPGEATVTAALRWVEGVGDRPFFLWLHLYEPHAPYQAPASFAARARDPYDAEIAAADDALGQLLTGLRERRIYERAMVLVASDHGEGLGDHGEQEHGILLYREAIQVPLLIKLPGGKRGGERVSTPVGLVDLLPTVCRRLGIELPAQATGRDLLAAEQRPRSIYSETYYPRIHLGWSELRSLVAGNSHYIGGPVPELYDLSADPAERNDRLAADRPAAFALRRELEALPANYAAPEIAATAEEVAKLAALGYLTTQAESASGPLPNPRQEIGTLAEVGRAAELARAGRLAESIAVCRQVLSTHPGLLDARLQLAWNLAQSGAFDESRREYREAVRRSPPHLAVVALDLARLEVQAGDPAAAEEQAKLALEAFPDQARLLIAEAALARGDAAGAEVQARALLAAAPAPGPLAPRLLLARTLAERGDFEAAQREVESLQAEIAAGRLAAAPGVDALFADLLARRGDYVAAESAFRREIERFPRSLDAYANLAILLAVQRRFPEIEPLLERMVAAVPEPRAYALAARTAQDLGNSALAASYRRRAGGSPVGSK